MADTPTTGRNGNDLQGQGGPVSVDRVSAWFVREVLPLEAILMHFLQHNWQNRGDIADLRQDVYARVFEAAQKQIPDNANRFLLTSARNLLIDRVRREQVVPIDVIADVDSLGVAIDTLTPDRTVMAREELRRLQVALDRLPTRCREAIVLAYVEGLNGQEIAQRMGITKFTVSEHLSNGLRALTDMLYGEPVDRGRSS
jgi:RNA polymerase sigma-70 factor (ECF subfamily)